MSKQFCLTLINKLKNLKKMIGKNQMFMNWLHTLKLEKHKRAKFKRKRLFVDSVASA